MRKLLFISWFLVCININHSQVFQQWVNRHNGGGTKVVVDKFSRVIVTGMDDDRNIYIVSYNSLGQQLWTDTYGGWEFHDDYPADLTTDRYGNVYLTGTVTNQRNSAATEDIVTIKYSPTGTRLWVKTYDYPPAIRDDFPRACVLSPDESTIYVAGQSNGNCFIISYDAISGSQYTYAYYGDTTGTLDVFNDIVVDNYGNIYTAGVVEVMVSGRSQDYLIMGYDAQLNPIWLSTYNGTGESTDEAFAMVRDNFNHCTYITGHSYSYTGGGSDYAVASYEDNGVRNWVKRYTGSQYGTDLSTCIALDSGKNVVVSGKSEISSSSYDIMTIKFNRAGQVLWSIRFIEDGGPIDNALSIASDLQNNIYVAGVLGLNVSTKSCLLKYSSNGGLLWNKNFIESYAFSVDVDNKLNAYITGHGYDTSLHQWNMLAIKYSQGINTTSQSKNSVNKPVNDNSFTRDTINFGQDALTPGTITDVDIQIDTLLHPNTADLEFTLSHNGITDTLIYRAGGSGDNFLGTFLDDQAANNVQSGFAPFTKDYKPYKPLSLFNGKQPGGAWVLSVYDRAAGNTGILKAWSLSVSVQYPIGIQTINNNIPGKSSLVQNFPNPFNPVTKIKFDISMQSAARLKVFDILGREVRTLVNQQLSPGTYEVDFDGSNLPSGVYYYKLQAGDFTETKKMVLIK